MIIDCHQKHGKLSSIDHTWEIVPFISQPESSIYKGFPSQPCLMTGKDNSICFGVSNWILKAKHGIYKYTMIYITISLLEGDWV